MPSNCPCFFLHYSVPNIRSLHGVWEKWISRPAPGNVLLSQEARNHVRRGFFPSFFFFFCSSKRLQTQAEEKVSELRTRRQHLTNALIMLEKELVALDDCKKETASRGEELSRCSLEKRAFQSTLIRCENRFLLLEV